MKTEILTILLLTLGLTLCSAELSRAAPMGTEFTYQGYLYDSNSVADGEYDFQFGLYDSNTAGSPLGLDVNKPNVDVIDGYFTVGLDFGGSVFDGNSVWLQIGVRPGDQNDPNAYTILSPRQRVTTVPYALYAKKTGEALNFSGSLSGDVSGTQTATTVTAIRGIAVSSTSPSANQHLRYDGSSWAPGNSEWADLTNVPAGFADGTDNVGGDGDWTILGNDIYSAVSGNVGIGTNTPTAKLTVNGAILRTGSTMYGANAHTHINLGTDSATGTSGQNYSYATVGGGLNNNATGNYSTVGGGFWNYAKGNYATVAGGNSNSAWADYPTIGGGEYNDAWGNYATVAGGEYNDAFGDHATVAGGSSNDAWGNYATAAGGLYNYASGDYSFAAGRRAKAMHNGSFVWADSADADFASTGNDQFLIRASGGMGIGTANPLGMLDVNGSIYQRGKSLHADYVFEPGYELESIEEHSEIMWKERHLPAIPKAKVDETGREILEVGAHRKGIVEELEKAHIYINQLHNRIDELRKQNIKMEKRLAAMETLMDKLALFQEGSIQ